MKRRWTNYAPWPFVGAAILLVILILVTPILVSTGHPAPGVLTQAILDVDRVPGGDVTNFYVVAYGEAIRYAGIWVGVAENFLWDGSGSLDWTSLHWTIYHNATNVITLAFNSTSNPIALNVSAYYVTSGASAFYVGELAFFVGPAGSSGLAVYAATPTAGVFVPSTPTPVDNTHQPFYIILSSVSLPGRLP